jgi:16S rRNA (guanine(966)-N(2))-methyltransferase RsmD
MRIMAGKFKGKNLFGSHDLSIRPLTNRIKKSIFDSLQNFYHDKSVLDLFSGSGSFGLEALSRGAKNVTFVEKSEQALHVLHRNLSLLSLANNCLETVHSDALKFCARTEISYDLILTDPPFNFPEIQNLVDLIFRRKILAEQGIMIIHHEITKPISNVSPAYLIRQQKKIGRSLVSYITNRM